MNEFILEFVRENPMLVVGLLALSVGTLSASVAIRVRKVNAENRFYDKLESDSLNQIEKNYKDIERILGNKVEMGAGKNSTLLDIMDGVEKDRDFKKFEQSLQSLARYFSEYCANLDKYNSNIMHRKQVCMIFQEHGRRARRIFKLFEVAGYSDIGIEFSKIHLQQAGIIGGDENS